VPVSVVMRLPAGAQADCQPRLGGGPFEVQVAVAARAFRRSSAKVADVEPAGAAPSAAHPQAIQLYFIENKYYFDRTGSYGSQEADYVPDPKRRSYAFFCAAALEPRCRESPRGRWCCTPTTGTWRRAGLSCGTWYESVPSYLPRSVGALGA
jgi:hypothetical protein